MGGMIGRIDLAHEPDFAIGPLSVRPSTREVARGDQREIIEPRVMQVLVALARAHGAVLSKDDLIEACWEGRMVGEDAVNRVLSRLRSLGAGLALGVFRVETVTRVGYRLRYEGDENGAADPNAATPDRRLRLDRRTAVVGGIAAAAAIGGAAIFVRPRQGAPDDFVEAIRQAQTALGYGSEQQDAAAVGLLQDLCRRFPDRAEGWGKLAVAYRRQGVFSRLPRSVWVLDRALAAARRALEIDSGNLDGAVVEKLGRGHWYAGYPAYEKISSEGFTRFAKHETARSTRSIFLYETGRIAESLTVSMPLVEGARLTARSGSAQGRKLWAVGRLEEADSLFEKLSALWPRHQSIWRSRIAMLTFSGRTQLAQEMLDEDEGLPDELRPEAFQLWSAQVQALRSGSEADHARVFAMFDAAAKTMNQIEEAAVFAAATGDLDRAFGYLEPLLWTGPEIAAFRRMFPAQYLQPHSGKLLYFLFEPPFAQARNDPRFAALAERLG
ncbi:MAG: winged helix-turn-helix domain-containing protein, partial [Novosphingobium sp.]